MRRDQGEVNHATKTDTSETGLINIYIHGGVILSALALMMGLVTAGSLDAATHVWWEFYISKLLPWPVDEFRPTSVLFELVISHAITIGVGLMSATSK